jgi:hypothetical protein
MNLNELWAANTFRTLCYLDPDVSASSAVASARCGGSMRRCRVILGVSQHHRAIWLTSRRMAVTPVAQSSPQSAVSIVHWYTTVYYVYT